MRTLLSLTIAALSLTASVASAAPVKAKAVSRASCPSSLPFALPDDRLSSDWGDMEWELWASSAWTAYCTGRESSHVCRCADAFGGGPY